MILYIDFDVLLGQINQSQSLFTYAQNESVDTFKDTDFVPMFADNITWHNESLRVKAEEECGEDYECLFDVASTNDLSVGMVTKDVSIQLVNESNALSKSKKGYSTLVLQCASSFSPYLKWVT